MEEKYFVELTYSDDSTMSFDVVLSDSHRNNVAMLYMIARGTLMASMARSVCAYDYDGFSVAAYIK